MDNKPINDELLRALAYYGAAGGSSGGGSGTNNYNDLLGKPVITSTKYPSGVVIKDTKSLQEYGIAETLQDYFDADASQEVAIAGPVSFKLTDTTNNVTIDLNSSTGFKLESGANSMQLREDGYLVFNGNFLYNLLHSLESQMSTSVLVDKDSWSSTTTLVNGINYYTNELSFTRVLFEHPEVTIDAMNSTDKLPSQAERDAYAQVTSSGYFFANTSTKKIICYSQIKPTTSFKIRVKGAY